MIIRFSFHMLPVVTVATGVLFGSAFAHANSEEGFSLENADRYIERADDLTEHADVVVEAADGIIESVDAVVEEVDEIVEDAIALREAGEEAFSREAMEHADELIEAADAVIEGNIDLLVEVYDLLLDADEKIEEAVHQVKESGPFGKQQKHVDKAIAELRSADEAVEAAIKAVCADSDEDSDGTCGGEEQGSYWKTCEWHDPEAEGAIGLARAADDAIEMADRCIEDYLDSNDPNKATIEKADDAVEAADVAVEAADEAIEAADKAIEKADKAIEKADKEVEKAIKKVS